jgi:hypothetical protein
MPEDFERVAKSVGDDRRAFLKKMAVGTAFAVPVVSSFSMSGVGAAFAQTPPLSPGNRGPGGTSTSSPTTTGGTTPSSSTTTTTSPNTTTTTISPNTTTSTISPNSR